MRRVDEQRRTELFILVILGLPGILVGSASEQAQKFTTNFPLNYDFSNTTGGKLTCSSNPESGSTVNWLLSDGSPVTNIARLRHMTKDGTLVFPPFGAEDYRQDVHGVSYRCAAINALGTLISNEIKVKGVVSQAFDIHVYDVYSLRGNSAVMRCHIPKFLQIYVHVTAWIKDSVVSITDRNLDSNSKYSLLPSGELMIKEVDSSDGHTTYQCQVTHRLTGQTKTSLNPGRLIVTDSDGRVPPKIVFTQPEVTGLKNGNILIPCVGNGLPVPKYSWQKQTSSGKTNSIGNKGRFKIVDGSLVIDDAQQSDTGLYICTVTNDVNYDKSSTELTILDPLTKATMVPSDAVVDAGGSFTLSCKISGESVLTISWSKDGKSLPLDGVIQTTNETVHIPIMQPHHAGIFQCFVQNDKFSSFGVAVVKLGDTLPIITKGFEELVVDAGDKIMLKCAVRGNPMPEIVWTLDNKPISENARIQFTAQPTDTTEMQSILRIVDAKIEDGGLYRCIATSKAGMTSFVSRVNVRGRLGVRLQVKFQAVEEGRIQLDCPVYGYPIIEIEWEKNKRILPVHLRQTTYDNGSLIIENVQRRSDSGIYTCLAKGDKNQRVRVDVDLIVMVPPKITPFSFQDDLIREGARAQIQCVISEGESPITINWRKDGAVLSEGQGVTVRTLDEFSSILMISFISPRHNGNYTCVASNAAGVARHTASLFVNVPPKIVPFSVQDKHLLEGMLVRVTCVVSRGDLPLTIKWLKNGHTISSDLSITIREFDEYSSVLSVDPLKSEHSGNYSCVAQNHAGLATHSINVNVLVPPRWLEELHNQILKTGANLYLNCAAEGFPQPEITWKKVIGRSGPITKRLTEHVEEDEHIKIFRNGTLALYDVQRSYEGLYLCVASNDVGEPLSQIVSIKVQAAPEFDQGEFNIIAKKGEEIKISCEAIGDWPIHYYWSMNDQRFDTKGSSRYKVEEEQDEAIKKSRSILQIEWLDRKDSTIFTCHAKNQIGQSETRFILTVQEFPDAPTIELPIKIINQSVEITWTSPYDGNSKITSYIIQYKKEIGRWTDRVNSLRINGLRNSAKILNLNAATLYSFRMIAENSVGNSTFSEEVSAKTEETEPDGAPENVDVESMDANTLRVTWKPPKKNLWNGAIRGYNIGYKELEIADEYTFAKLEVPEDYVEELIYQLTDLKMYTQYNVIVQAYNSKGNGPMSEAVLGMTSEDVPSHPPQNVRCSSLSSKSIYALWDPPAPETLNGILRGYKILYKPVDEWYDAMMQSQIVSATKQTVNDLEVNTNYSIQILAFTKMGDGAKSAAIFCKTHEDVPDPPESIKVLPSSSDAVVVAWKPPQRANGALIKYNVYFKSIENGQEIDINSQKTEELLKHANVQQSPITTQYVELKGLKKNQKYAFWVTVTSAIGESSGSTVVAQTVADSIVAAKTASFDTVIKSPWKEDLVMPCTAVGVPPPNRKWTFGNQVLKESNRLKIGQDGSVIINKISTEDSGNYTCAVYNEYGRDEVTYLVAVQVPPSAPIIDIVSKTRSSTKIQWKPGHTAKDNIKGYLLHYKQDNTAWNTVEIRSDQSLYTLDQLSCGSTYQIYMEAFNNIGTGAPCDIITVTTDGSDVTPPPKDNIIREGSSFITVHLDAWPSSGCPVKKFTVEYKPLNAKEWISAGTNLRPSQKKLVISELVPSTWYVLRLTVESTSTPTIAEYRFATHTVTGGTMAPDTYEESAAPVYIFYLDPMIFIPAVALLIVVIIASMVVCIYFKRRNGHAETPDNYDNTAQMNAWIRNSQTLPRDHFNHPAFQATLSSQSTKEPSPYATSHLTDPYHPDHVKFRAGPHGFSNLEHESYPTAASGFRPQATTQLNETTFTFPTQSDDYDPPPMAHLIRNSIPELNQQN